MGPQARKRWTYVAVCAALAVVTVATYWPVGRHEFINYDDQKIYDNPRLTSGLTLDNIGWAFVTSEHANWFPLTRLSWMIDWQLFRDASQPKGDWAGGHHMVSVGIHVASGIILFLSLAWMTGRRWPSAAVAALFLLHPLHIQSVAWAAERKDVLSALFWMAALAAYAWYVRRPSIGRYAAVFVAMALGLMAKPMVVTLPAVLLLLDFWPLGRLRLAYGGGAQQEPQLQPQGGRGRKAGERGKGRQFPLTPIPSPAAGRGVPATAARIILEKVPLVVLSIASSAWTYHVQHTAGAVSTSSLYPQVMKIQNTLMSYVRYLGLTFWPHDLAVFYPYPQSIPWWPVALAAAALVAVTAGAVWLVRSRGYLAAGWFWYVGTLVPVIGIVQVGSQEMADRYTYLPLIGIFIMAAWAVDDLAGRWNIRWAAGAAALVVAVALIAATRSELRYWASSETLFSRSLAVTNNNWLAHYNYAAVLTERDAPGDNDAAIGHLREAVSGKGDDPDAFNSLGRALVKRGTPEDLNEAYRNFLISLQLDPRHAKAHNNLANLLKMAGDVKGAADHYASAIHEDPDYAEAHNNLANLMAQLGRSDDAIREYREAIRIKPDLAEPHNNLAAALVAAGDIDGAIEEYRAAVRIRADFPQAHHGLAGLLVARGRMAEAIHEYRETIRQAPGWAMARGEFAWLLATGPEPSQRSGAEAVRLASDLCAMTDRKDVRFLDLLAVSYAEAGMFTEAVDTANEAIALASSQGRTQEAADIQGRLRLFQSGRAFHMGPAPGK